MHHQNISDPFCYQKQDFQIFVRQLTVFVVAVFASLLTGCTTSLTTKKVDLSGKTPVEGQIYYLPRTEFSVELKRELKGYSVAYENEGVAVIEWLRDQGAASVDYDKLLKDPVFNLPGIEDYFIARFGVNWKQNLRPPIKDGAANRDLTDWLNNNVSKSHIQLVLEVSMHTTSTPFNLMDTNHVYAIQYTGMSKGRKKTDYAVQTYPNSTLKSINMTVEDKTGPAILSTLNGVAKVVAASYGVPLPTGGQQVGGDVQSFEDWLKQNQANVAQLLSADTRLNLEKKKVLASVYKATAEKLYGSSKGVIDQQKRLDEAQKTLATEQKKLAEMEADDPGIPAQKIVVQNARVKVNTETVTLKKLQDDYGALAKLSAKKSKELAKVQELLTISEATLFIPDKQRLSTGELGVPLAGTNEALDAWLDSLKVKAFCVNAGILVEDFRSKIAESLFAYVTVYPSRIKVSERDVSEGIVYRQPAQVLLLVARGYPTSVKDGSFPVLQENILLSSRVEVPQLGVLASLPLRNKMFQNNNFEASFSESTALSSLKYTTNAALESAADTLNQAADVYAQLRNAEDGKEKADLERSTEEANARTELYKAQLEVEKAKQELERFINDPDM